MVNKSGKGSTASNARIGEGLEVSSGTPTIYQDTAVPSTDEPRKWCRHNRRRRKSSLRSPRQRHRIKKSGRSTPDKLCKSPQLRTKDRRPSTTEAVTCKQSETSVNHHPSSFAIDSAVARTIHSEGIPSKSKPAKLDATLRFSTPSETLVAPRRVLSSDNVSSLRNPLHTRSRTNGMKRLTKSESWSKEERMSPTKEKNCSGKATPTVDLLIRSSYNSIRHSSALLSSRNGIQDSTKSRTNPTRQPKNLRYSSPNIPQKQERASSASGLIDATHRPQSGANSAGGSKDRCLHAKEKPSRNPSRHLDNPVVPQGVDLESDLSSHISMTLKSLALGNKIWRWNGAKSPAWNAAPTPCEPIEVIIANPMESLPRSILKLSASSQRSSSKCNKKRVHFSEDVYQIAL